MGAQSFSLASPRRRSPAAQWLRTYAEFARVGFVDTLAYRLRYYTGIVTYFIYVSVYYFIWRAIYAHSAHIAGFDFSQILTYISVGWIIRSFYFNNIDQDLATQVTEGALVMNLIKPVNLQLMMTSQALGQAVFRLALLTVPTAAILFLIFPLRWPADGLHFLAFFVSVIFSFFIVAGINFAVGTVAIRLKSILGLLRAKFFLLDLFSGLLLPISFFPHAAQSALAVMPFQYISYVPVMLYIGKISGAGILKALGIQLFWVLAMLALGNVMWRWSSRKITIQGG
ncbi:MAG TPA: ABC-2 family transporter protein [Terriglobia bacterium]|nr:ABC-2 family transporter protein [Terriglobia bacterium]